MTKEELKSIFDKINVIELQILAKHSNIEIYINKKLKSKTTLISEILDYLYSKDEKERLEILYQFSYKGNLLFYPIGYKLDKSLMKFKKENIEKIYKETKIDDDISIYQPKTMKKLFQNVSIYVDKDFMIFFKKYHNNSLSINKEIKNIEKIFDIKLEPYISDDIYFTILNILKVNKLKYTIKLSKGFIVINYISHQFKNNSVKISSRLNYLRPATKKVDFINETTSEYINNQLEKKGIPKEVLYSVNIPNSNKITINSCGINIYLKNDDIIRYAILMKQKEFRLVHTDTDIKDIINVSKAFKIIDADIRKK